MCEVTNAIPTTREQRCTDFRPAPNHNLTDKGQGYSALLRGDERGEKNEREDHAGRAELDAVVGTEGHVGERRKNGGPEDYFQQIERPVLSFACWADQEEVYEVAVEVLPRNMTENMHQKLRVLSRIARREMSPWPDAKLVTSPMFAAKHAAVRVERHARRRE